MPKIQAQSQFFHIPLKILIQAVQNLQMIEAKKIKIHLQEHANDSDDDEERFVDFPFAYCNSDQDAERDKARDNVQKYVELKKSLQQEDQIDAHAHTIDNVGDGNQDGGNGSYVLQRDMVRSYESDYISLSDPGSFEETSKGLDTEDTQRHRSSRKVYKPIVPLEDFCLDLRFKDLKHFKKELVDFSMREGFEFRYVKNDSVRVRAVCLGKNCKWLILCSQCSRKRFFTVKNYILDHSCLLGATRN